VKGTFLAEQWDTPMGWEELLIVFLPHYLWAGRNISLCSFQPTYGLGGTSHCVPSTLLVGWKEHLIVFLPAYIWAGRNFSLCSFQPTYGLGGTSHYVPSTLLVTFKGYITIFLLSEPLCLSYTSL